MKKLDLPAIKERCDKATPGPWKHDHMHDGEMVFNSYREVNFIQRFEDARFIAHARQDIPALLDYIAQLEAERDGETRIRLLQYDNLRQYFRILTAKVLGADYYNMAMDVYECDRITCEDLLAQMKPRGLLCGRNRRTK